MNRCEDCKHVYIDCNSFSIPIIEDYLCTHRLVSPITENRVARKFESRIKDLKLCHLHNTESSPCEFFERKIISSIWSYFKDKT